MPYTSSAAIAGRSTLLSYKTVGTSPATFITVAELRKIDFTGSKYDLDEITNMQSGTVKEWITTLADAGEISFEGNFLPKEESQDALYNTFFIAGLLGLWKVTMPGTNGIITFNGYVTKFDLNFDVSKHVTVNGAIKITGQVFLP